MKNKFNQTPDPQIPSPQLGHRGSGVLGITFISSIVFICLMLVGLYLAVQKPLWNDEMYTQKANIDRLSYAQILTMDFEEANKCPLFYLIQKGICDLAGYKFDLPWNNEWTLSDTRSQIILRLSSNIFMSLGLTALFFYFARFYSWASALYALGVGLSSFMVWAYWAEGRHYAQWFSLSILQALFFIHLTRQPNSVGAWRGLIATHFLLSLTVILSVVQIILVSALVFLLIEKNWRRLILLCVIPVAIAIWYYLHATKYNFFFVETPLELFLANMPWERLIIFISAAMSFGVWFMQKKDLPKEYIPYVCLLGGVILSVIALLIYFKMNEVPGARGFSLSIRYFIYLAAFEIVGTVLFSYGLWRLLAKDFWMKVNLFIGLGGLLILRCLKTFISLSQLKIY